MTENLVDQNGNDILRCPECGHIAPLDGFDCIGADGSNLFCTQCHFEGQMETIPFVLGL